MHRLLIAALLGGLVTGVGCSGVSSKGSSSGNSGSTPPPSGQNVMPVGVNSGPLNRYANGLFASVTVCIPGSSTCQTVSGVLVDTGSYGLRILSSALGTVSLPQQTNASGPVVECAQFSDGITWGPVKTADVKMAGEQASSIPIQVIGDANFSTVPANCSKKGTPMDTQNDLLANGILGVGPFAQDCGRACTTLGPSNPGFYYVCPTASTCTETPESISQQVQNPVAMFSTDNNGVILELPAVATTGAPSVNGSMIFGIGTQSNNGVGSAKVFTLDLNTGNFTTVFKGTPYSNSFIDSGSNGIFFLDTTTTGIPVCSTNASGFYCPNSVQNLTATQQGANGTSGTVSFSVANANTLFMSNNFAFNDLAGPNANTFDWGLPFFFGRNVYTGMQTPTQGPYWAY